MSNKILFLCSQKYLESESDRERKSIFEALKSYAQVFCLDCFDRSIVDFIKDQNFDLVFHPDVHRPYLPEGLVDVDTPTACLHIDTYSEPENRMRVSLLFDWALVCHPGYPERFEANGHPETALFPLAVRKKYYSGSLPEKDVDVAMVGRLSGKDYSCRRQCVDEIVKMNLEMNDLNRYYDYAEMADLYKRAKIGLNISRNSHLADANLRCFEVMGGGALLVTPAPTELTAMGLQDGIHFVSFSSKKELRNRVQYYLSNEQERKKIALNGRRETLKRFTYDSRAKQIVKRIEAGIPLQAPARSMGEGDVAALYVDYYSKRGNVNRTLDHLQRQKEAGSSVASLIASVAKAAKVTVRRWQRTLSQ